MPGDSPAAAGVNLDWSPSLWTELDLFRPGNLKVQGSKQFFDVSAVAGSSSEMHLVQTRHMPSVSPGGALISEQSWAYSCAEPAL